jgi:HEAT repeat protein
MLNALGERALVPLVAALADADPDTASHIAAALDPAESNYLIFRHDTRWRLAIDALDLLSDSDVDILVTAADHDDENVARVAVALLERLGHPAAVRTPKPEPEPVERGVEDLADYDPAVRTDVADTCTPSLRHSPTILTYPQPAAFSRAIRTTRSTTSESMPCRARPVCR